MSDYPMEESISRDRLSELPNSLIHHIYSFLPMRDVVSTTFLSKRWNNLWTTISSLNFCNLIVTPMTMHYNEAEIEKVRNFVNRALIFWRGVGILKFKLDINWNYDAPLAADVDLWVRFAVEHKVEELNISLMGSREASKKYYWAPPCLNSCSSIRELCLVGCNLRIPVIPPWNQLKSLKFYCFCFTKRLINRILLGSPRLEVFEFCIMDRYENLNIRSTSLKKLKIMKLSPYETKEPLPDKVLRIRCPNLEKLGLFGSLYPKYLLRDILSLTDATLAFNSPDDFRNIEIFEETMKQIFISFQHVDKITLSTWCVQVLGALQGRYLLSSLPSDKFFPNLKMLVIVGWTFEGDTHEGFERELSKSFMLQLKTIDIRLYLPYPSTFWFIEFLLKNASMLEKLVIRVNTVHGDWLEVAEELLCMPRSSPTAKVFLKKTSSFGNDTSF